MSYPQVIHIVIHIKKSGIMRERATFPHFHNDYYYYYYL
nr:MAG TPA: hypothetical protein [Microviridae sp.]